MVPPPRTHFHFISFHFLFCVLKYDAITTILIKQKFVNIFSFIVIQRKSTIFIFVCVYVIFICNFLFLFIIIFVLFFSLIIYLFFLNKLLQSLCVLTLSKFNSCNICCNFLYNIFCCLFSLSFSYSFLLC